MTVWHCGADDKKVRYLAKVKSCYHTTQIQLSSTFLFPLEGVIIKLSWISNIIWMTEDTDQHILL